MDDADVIGLNRLSASIRIWTEQLARLDTFAVALVLIAFRLQFEFGYGNDYRQYYEGKVPQS